MKTLAALLIALTVASAYATTIHFHGTITSIEDTPPIMAQVGNPFRGTLVFDPNRPFNQDGDPNVSLDIFITTMLGIFHTSLEPTYSFYIGGFGPSIAGESMSQRETMFINFLSPDLRSFTAGVTFWDECIPCIRLGVVQASGIASIPETGSTFALLLLGVVGLAMLPKVKSMIGFIFLVGVCVTSLWAEYNLAVRFAIMFSVASVSGLLALLGALLRAREGYENENGFHIRGRRKQARRPRRVLAEDKPVSHKGIFTATTRPVSAYHFFSIIYR